MLNSSAPLDAGVEAPYLDSCWMMSSPWAGLLLRAQPRAKSGRETRAKRAVDEISDTRGSHHSRRRYRIITSTVVPKRTGVSPMVRLELSLWKKMYRS